MSIFLLWFNEWEANYVLGVFETREVAEGWRDYFIKNPFENFMSVEYYSKKPDFADRFEIQEYELGKLHPHIKIDNLKYLAYLDELNHKESK